MQSKQELFLQNALAQAASLLHQTVTLLNKSPSPVQLCLIIEIQTFFLETKESLSLMMKQEQKPPSKVSSGSAPTVQSPGLNWREKPSTQETSPGESSPGPAWKIPPRRTPTSYEAEASYPTCYGSPTTSDSKTSKPSSNPFLDN